MSRHIKYEPPRWFEIALLTMLCAPMIVDCIAFYMWFIPNPSFRLQAAVVGGVYVVLLGLLRWFGFGWRRNLAEKWRRGKSTRSIAALALGIFAIGFLAYRVVLIVIPDELTKFYGNSAERSVIVKEIYRHMRASPFCLYTVTITSHDNNRDTDFCLSDVLANQLHVGEELHLHGKETRFGFSFSGYSD
ncbi:hypothetical protein [Rhodanobacter sp. MP1X3]|uniref:hypothetical protein n=1 Tax=Rhodanobacter sp. MP1X3 TaxID=2723086 RepID=UPI00161E0C13|nr:hypothetical protein [Rhodanobacter sp. MP1X3]MBB6242408.1 hypothetical protein [Rhodanobacter sp. MP1X3]